ncbi:MAG: T9SS type A sorting domain-containing protein [Bacteroidota bacterium]
MRLIQFVSLSILLLISLPGRGQISYQATYYPAAGNPGGLNAEAEFSTVGWTPLLPGGLSGNQWSNSATVPFYFEFFGQSVSSFKTSANGVLTFDLSATSLPGNNGVVPNGALPDLSIACFWEAFAQNPPTGTNDQVQYKTFGTAPNRQFWVRWASFEWGPSSFAYVAIVLEESTYDIHVVDMYSSLTSNWITSTVGVQEDVSFGIMAGDVNQPLSGAGSSPSDNSYYTFEPFPIPPQDVKPVGITSLSEVGCGYGQENVTFRLTNIGQLTASNVQAAYSVDGSPPVPLELVASSLASGDTIDFTFSQKADLSTPGIHTLQVWTQTPGDGQVNNDTLSLTVENVLQVNNLPYYEDFEAGESGWTVQGTNPSWEWGTPANPTIQGGASGTKAWVTGRTGTHNSFENSWVISPCFDLSSANADTWLRMNVWWESEAGWDGAAIQASSDGGENWLTIGSVGASDWYNTVNINALPGGQSAGWSGTQSSGTGSGEYVAVSHPLPPGLVGHSSVRFRIAFASGGAQNGDGFAFDDFALGTPPSVQLGPSGYYCNGNELDAGNPGMHHLWSTGATSQAIPLINTSGSAILDSMLWVEVTDSIGLFRRDTIIFSLSPPLSINGVTTQDVICAGDETGSILMQVAGGLAPLNFAWNQGSQEQNPVQLPAGEYSVLITDANDCELQSDTISIQESDSIAIIAEVVNVACAGDSNGSISIQTSGGFAPYTYQWSQGDTLPNLDQLTPGTYVLTITDQAACEFQEVFTIINPDTLSATVLTIDNSPCSDASGGRIELAVAGGTAPFTYAWSNGNETQNPDDLSPGVYGVSIVDDRGCATALDSIEVGYDLSIPIPGFYIERLGALTVRFVDSSEAVSNRYWTLGNGIHSSQATFEYTYAEAGLYEIVQRVYNDCGADSTSAWLDLRTVGLADLTRDQFQLYPNPSEGSFVIRSAQSLEQGAEIQVLNLQGKPVYQATLTAGNRSEIPVQLDQGLARGIYLIEVKTEAGRWVKKLELR